MPIVIVPMPRVHLQHNDRFMRQMTGGVGVELAGQLDTGQWGDDLVRPHASVMGSDEVVQHFRSRPRAQVGLNGYVYFW